MSLGVIYLNTSCDPNFVTVITTTPILKKNNIIKKSIHNIKKFSNKLDFHSLNKKHF